MTIQNALKEFTTNTFTFDDEEIAINRNVGIFITMNPSENSNICTIYLKSGAIIEIGRNCDFKLSGNSDLPAYVGFMVINIPTFLFIAISSSSKVKVFVVNSFNAFWIVIIC
jgi:hypothetical protein